jgi:anaerobic nitric oxide reductase flavorubredoxin
MDEGGRAMKAHKISDRIYALHADVRTEDLFEGIWPIPDGVSLNSYLVKGDKIALIDLVRDWGGAPAALESGLSQAGVRLVDVDYLVLNHLEPDHTGWLADFRRINSKVRILATAKGVELVKNFYKVENGVEAVKTGDVLDLGAGLVLSFVEAPNVHWPETMVTFEPSSGTLFSCDAFGSFGMLGDRMFDDEFSPRELERFEVETLRYYANIVASFGIFVRRAIEKLANLDVKIVAPSHGIAWRKDPKRIIDRYLKYASYLDGGREKEICVVWGSMYGNTEKGLEAAIRGIEDEGVPFTMHRVPNEDVSYILADAYRSEGILVAMPTYEYKMFPPMAYVLDIFTRKHVNGRSALRIGSWGWVGGAKKEYDDAIAALEWKSIESLEWAGVPDDAVLAALREKGRGLARMVKAAK